MTHEVNGVGCNWLSCWDISICQISFCSILPPSNWDYKSCPQLQTLLPPLSVACDPALLNQWYAIDLFYLVEACSPLGQHDNMLAYCGTPKSTFIEISLRSDSCAVKPLHSCSLMWNAHCEKPTTLCILFQSKTLHTGLQNEFLCICTELWHVLSKTTCKIFASY